MQFSRKNLLGILGSTVSLAVLLGFASSAQADPKTLYVATTGHYQYDSANDPVVNRNYFSSKTTPAISISVAANVAQAGDTIEVALGTYDGIVAIKSKSNLLIQPPPGSTTKPVLRDTVTGPNDGVNDYAIVKIVASDNITFKGFEVVGAGAGPNCGGIAIIPQNNTNGSITSCHHISISYNKVHDLGGGGIGSGQDPNTKTTGNDYINITGNEIYNCNSSSIYNGSAISILRTRAFDNAGGYHNVIQTNRVYENVNRNSDQINGHLDYSKHTDGNGIIMDTTGVNGTKTLIQNNLVYRNGGRGIHVFLSSNVDVLNNTCYQNCQDDAYFTNPDVRNKYGIGEMTVVGYGGVNCQNVNIYNNLCSSRPARVATQTSPATPAAPVYAAINYGTFIGTSTTQFNSWPLERTVKFDHNLYWGGVNSFYRDLSPSVASNFLNQQPLFGNAGGGDFTLSANSAGVDDGTTVKYASSSYNGVARPQGGGVDMGAYER